jgi:sigma-B regulation protein RsbU (phosphoserine phosphatase)
VGPKTVITLALLGPETGPLGSSDSTPGILGGASPPGLKGWERPDEPPLAPGLQTIAPPARIRPGQTMLSPPPGKEVAAPLTTVNELGASPDFGTLARWMETVLALQRSSAGPEEFSAQTARAMIDLIGLDVALVLLRDNQGWRELARAVRPELPAERPATREYSHTVLGLVVEKQLTFFQDIRPVDAQKSLLPANAVVASPIFGLEDDVVGALYGVRLWQTAVNAAAGRPGGGPAEARIRPLEAQMVQLLAAAVSANQTRMTATEIERDLVIARSIQVSFLPEGLPTLPGWEIGARFDPAREASGDFYDVFPLSEDHLALVIADVCDKGLAAAVFMALYRTLLRAFAQQTFGRGLSGASGEAVSSAGGVTDQHRLTLLAELTARSTIKLTNDYIAWTHASACMFATVFFGVLDTSTDALTYVNAGHDFPVLLQAGGARERVERTGPVVGVNPDAEYDIGHARLEPGDALFAYTDGVTEARNPADEFFGERRLLALLAEVPFTSADDLLEKVIARLDEHVAGAEPSEDTTLLAVRRLPRSAPQGEQTPPSQPHRDSRRRPGGTAGGTLVRPQRGPCGWSRRRPASRSARSSR